MWILALVRLRKFEKPSILDEIFVAISPDLSSVVISVVATSISPPIWLCFLALGPAATLVTMVKLTMIARVTDGLLLVEGLDDGRDVNNNEFYKHQARALFKNLSKGQNEASRMSIETGPYVFHYIIEGRVCYLTMCDRSYPKKLAFQYLEDLKTEFERVNGNQIETAGRPYAFIKFDTFIQKTKKLYLDTRTQRNLAKLNDELYEVHQIMTRNVQEVLGVGEKLDQVSQLSSRLTSESRIYADKAKDLNRQALIRKWAPVAIVLGVVIFLFWIVEDMKCFGQPFSIREQGCFWVLSYELCGKRKI
ncbi:hypothetical protein NE237_005000 [Protea cynaroides]|uniref:25.3 kDa vesicle transport protein n=1 Tax=Protea cynaroides TaxID=273540 RepID=A0A9Q0KKJ8_9MAGN|nr:hypothetical protein NE237_005000 [Protea cynaroides]